MLDEWIYFMLVMEHIGTRKVKLTFHCHVRVLGIQGREEKVANALKVVHNLSATPSGM